MPEALLDLLFWVAVLAAMFFFFRRKQKRDRSRDDE